MKLDFYPNDLLFMAEKQKGLIPDLKMWVIIPEEN